MTQDIYSLVMAHAKQAIIFLIVYSVLITGLLTIFFIMLDSKEGYEDETGFHTLEDDIKELEARLSSLRNDYGILVRENQQLKLTLKDYKRVYQKMIEYKPTIKLEEVIK